MLLIPVFVTIGLLPVADFIDNPEITDARKWFILGIFGISYFTLIAYAFLSGIYLSKEDILFTSINTSFFSH